MQRTQTARTVLLAATLASFFAFSLNAPTKAAEDSTVPVVKATVNADEVVSRIDEKVYSHFLEHIYNSCNGGLWGELVWNRSLEASSSSGWVFEDGVLKQTGRQTDCRFLLGAEQESKEKWTDYDVRVLAKKIAGSEGFLVLFRAAPDMSSYYWLNLGGWQNQYVAIEKETPTSNGRHVVGGQKRIPPIEAGEIYDIRIVVTGQNIKVFVNQELVHEIVDPDENAPKSGCVGVGTWGTEAEFGSVLVRDLRRKTLFDLQDAELQSKSSVNVRYWSIDGQAKLLRGDARNSDKYLRYSSEGSLKQENYAFREGEVYDYSFWTRGNGKVSFSVNSDEEKDVASFPVNQNEWVKMSGEFTVAKSSDAGSISLRFNPSNDAYVDVDQISIFPRSWKEQYGGLRPDLLNAIADIKPTAIRWPGGCYASAYRWKSGIGPQDDRVAYPLELWNDVDVNSFGIDEFVPFCRRVGAEPIMVVNIGTPQWLATVGDPELRKNDWLQEACDWVEYCNGSADSRWGAVRAKNGRPEPYGVKYWEIDNEVQYNTLPSDKYCAIINELVPRMKKIDPSIKVIVCGSWMGDGFKWDTELVEGAGKNFDYLSMHRYDNPDTYANNPYDNQRYFERHRDMIAKSSNPHVRLFSSEWNAQSTDWRTGLYAGGYLNCCERVSDILEIAAPALFLRHKSANGWDNAFVNFDAASWYPAPNYVVMKLWRDNFAPNLVAIRSDSPELQGNAPPMNVVATKSEDGKTVFVKGVNNLEKDVEFQVDFATLSLDNATVTSHCVSPDLQDGEEVKAKLRKRNMFDAPNAIAPRQIEAKKDGTVVSIKAPSLSAFVVKVVTP